MRLKKNIAKTVLFVLWLLRVGFFSALALSLIALTYIHPRVMTHRFWMPFAGVMLLYALFMQVSKWAHRHA